MKKPRKPQKQGICERKNTEYTETQKHDIITNDYKFKAGTLYKWTRANRPRGAFAVAQHVQSESLLKHAYAVEAAMRRMAHHFHQDEDLWGVAGLLYDLDYREYPEEHCQHVESMLREAGYGDAMVRAILSHGYGLCTEVKPQTDMEKSLYAVDELTGLITAVVLMRPSNLSWILR